MLRISPAVIGLPSEVATTVSGGSFVMGDWTGAWAQSTAALAATNANSFIARGPIIVRRDENGSVSNLPVCYRNREVRSRLFIACDCRSGVVVPEYARALCASGAEAAV